jgi:DNA-binding transcriptional regulator LsrR (DeoR family)
LRWVAKGVGDVISDVFSQIVLQENDTLGVVWDDVMDQAVEVLYVQPIPGVNIVRGEVDSR